jgi:A/G-specific adenine glycosylase
MTANKDNRFAAIILEWFEQHGRDLPWRRTHDAYAIWLSEVVLQQTRIDQGLAYWERLITRFPTVADLAAASEDEVLRLWQGLGYYSRARNLHAAAKQITAMGGFPRTREGIKALKGVGDYTSAAVASMAFNLPVAAVDGNVYRVLARHFGINTPIDTGEGKRIFAQMAQALLPADRPGDFNQAMMDFGATQCTPASPQCGKCPLADTCDALHTGRIKLLPAKSKATKVAGRQITYIYIRQGCYTAIRRRPAGDIWQGLWEPLLIEGKGLPPMDGRLTLIKKGVKHVLTHRILTADFYLLETDTRPKLPSGYQWIAESELDNYALPRLVEKLIEALNGEKQ